MMNDKEVFMKEALKEAKKAYKKLEIPVGVVIVHDGKIIARAHNIKEEKQSAIKHAEIIAIERASKKIKNWRLNNCEMYVTLEPCPMCAGAILNSRINKVYIGALDEKTGACGSKLNLLQDFSFDTSVYSQTGILENECKQLLQDFFKELRKIKKQY